MTVVKAELYAERRKILRDLMFFAALFLILVLGLNIWGTVLFAVAFIFSIDHVFQGLMMLVKPPQIQVHDDGLNIKGLGFWEWKDIGAAYGSQWNDHEANSTGFVFVLNDPDVGAGRKPKAIGAANCYRDKKRNLIVVNYKLSKRYANIQPYDFYEKILLYAPAEKKAKTSIVVENGFIIPRYDLSKIYEDKVSLNDFFKEFWRDPFDSSSHKDQEIKREKSASSLRSASKKARNMLWYGAEEPTKRTVLKYNLYFLFLALVLGLFFYGIALGPWHIPASAWSKMVLLFGLFLLGVIIVLILKADSTHQPLLFKPPGFFTGVFGAYFVVGIVWFIGTLGLGKLVTVLKGEVRAIQAVAFKGDKMPLCLDEGLFNGRLADPFCFEAYSVLPEGTFIVEADIKQSPAGVALINYSIRKADP